VNLRSLAALALVLAACQTTGSASATPATEAPPPAPDFLVRRPAFTGCELEGFMSLTAARNAIVFADKKENLLGKAPTPWRTAMVEELYARKADDKLTHAGFAAQKFYECADRERLGLARNAGAWVCFARLDVVFYLDADRRKGRTRDEAVARFQRSFAKVPKAVFPDGLVDKIAPMVFRITTDEGEYELRRFVLETCLFPDDWKAWWDAVGSKQG
jgi:hypothetical protein